MAETDSERIIGESPSSYSNENEYMHDINEIETLIRSKLVSYRELEYGEYRKNTHTFIRLLEKYQEQPYILDNYLERICSPLTGAIAEFLDLVSETLHENIVSSEKGHSKLETDCVYQANVYRLSDCIYTICKIRGLKTISLYFPSEVKYLEAVIDCITLRNQMDENIYIKDDSEINWHFTYVLHVWLTTLVLTPFSFEVLDSKYMFKELDLFKRILDIIIPKVLENRYCIINETSSYVFAKILCRTDFTSLWRQNYGHLFDHTIAEEMNKNPNSLGILIWIKYLVKLGPVESIELFINRMIDYLQIPREEGDETLLNKTKVNLDDGQHLSVKSLGCKLVCISNIVIRCMGNESLKRHICNSVLDWSLSLMLSYNKSNHSLLKHTSSKCISKILHSISLSNGPESSIYIHRVLEEILLLSSKDLKKNKYRDLDQNELEGRCLTIAELIRKRIDFVFENYLDEIVAFLKYCLGYQEWIGSRNLGIQIRDSACYIIWSLARNVPSNMLLKHTDHILMSLIPLTVFDTQINGRRSSCAALQEFIGRQGGENVPFGISIVTTADFFTISSLKASFIEISTKIGSLSVKDERDSNLDLICSRSGPLSLDCDYPFSNALAGYLIKNVFNHPQIKYRLLSLVAFSKLVPFCMNYCYSQIIQDILNTGGPDNEDGGISLFSLDPIQRHSSLLIISVLLLKSGNLENGVKSNFWNRLVTRSEEASDCDRSRNNLSLSQEFTWSDYVRNIPIIVEKNRFYRGKGGELTRKGVLYLIVSLCKSTNIVQFRKATFTRFLQTILDSIKHLSFNVQMSGTSALSALIEWRMERCKNSPSLSEILSTTRDFISLVNKEHENVHIMALRGIILNIGLIFPKIAPLVDEDLVVDSLNCLMGVFNRGVVELKGDKSSSLSQCIVFSSYDVECRRNSVFSLGMVMLSIKNNSNVVLCDNLFNEVHNLLLRGCFDYSIDKRGDVGSWIRELSMEVVTCLYLNNIYSDSDSDTSYFNGIVLSLIFNVFNYSDKLRLKAILLLYKVLRKSLMGNLTEDVMNMYWVYYRIFYGIPYEISELLKIQKTDSECSNTAHGHTNRADSGSDDSRLFGELFKSCSNVLENLKLMYSKEQRGEVISFFSSKTSVFNNSCLFFDLLDSIETLPHSLLPFIDFDNQFLFYLSNRNFQVFSNSDIQTFKANFLKFILESHIQEPAMYGIVNWVSHDSSTTLFSHTPKNNIGYELSAFLLNATLTRNDPGLADSIFSFLRSLVALLCENVDGGASFFLLKILMHAFRFMAVLFAWDMGPHDMDILKDILARVEKLIPIMRDFQLIKAMSCVFVQFSFNENVGNGDEELVNLSLGVLSQLISHEYPAIRSYTADLVYNSICYVQDSRRVDKILEFIRENEWLGGLTQTDLLRLRDQFSEITRLGSRCGETLPAKAVS